MISTTDKRLRRFELSSTERCMSRSSYPSSPYMPSVAYSIKESGVSLKRTSYCSFLANFRVPSQKAMFAQFYVHAIP
jgi:hypothetical protein